MDDKPKQGPDHTLASAPVPDDGAEPQIYSVVDLKAYLKPTMDEELTGIEGEPADPGTELVCECVPVEDCVCNTVTYYSGGCPSTCACHSQCVGGLYWHPY